MPKSEKTNINSDMHLNETLNFSAVYSKETYE